MRNKSIATIATYVGVGILTLCLTFASPVQAQRAKGQKAPLAVLPFAPMAEVQSVPHWRMCSDRITDTVIEKLVDKNLPVVERAQMGNLEDEQILEMTGQVASAVALGKKAGARYMLMGSIAQLKARSKKILLYEETTLEVKLRARLVDIQSGLILKTFTSEGKETKRGVVNPFVLEGEAVANAFEKPIERASDDLAKKVGEGYPDGSETAAPVASNGNEAENSPTGENGLSGDIEGKLKKLKESGEISRLSVMVVIPETHIQRPRIPDPAAETEIIRRLVNAGFKVLDDQRVRQLREETWVREAAKGEVDRAQLDDLRNRFGAEVLIVGEGISERAENPRQGGNTVLVRGRVEIRAIRLDTGEILAAEGLHAPGRELSEALASKASLQQAGAQVAPKMIAALVERGFQGGPRPNAARVMLEIGGWSKISQTQEFLTALGSIKGVKKAERREFRGGVLFAEVEVDREAARNLAVELEMNTSLKRFNIAIDTSGETKIVGRCSR